MKPWGVLLLCHFILWSCGDYKATGGQNLGEERSYSPVTVDSSQVQMLSSLCQALTEKASLLASGSSQTYEFTTLDKKCGSSTEVEAKDITVYTEVTPLSYNFRRSDNGQLFVYPEIETAQSGVTKDLCSNLTNLTNPMKSSHGVAIWFTLSKEGMSDCTPASNELCLMIETGSPKNDKFTIVAREWMKFQLDRNLSRFGFYNFRKTYSNAFCQDNQYSETSAVMK